MAGPSRPGIVALICLVCNSYAFDLKFSQLLYGIDFIDSSVAFRCDDECTVYATGDEYMGVSNASAAANQPPLTTFRDIEQGVDSNSYIKGYTLQATKPAQYKVTRTGEANGLFYVLQKASSLYGIPVVSVEESTKKSINIDTQYITIISKYSFTIGEIETDGVVKIYTAPADFGDSDCRPVYTSRTASNAKKSYIYIPSPIATIDFGDAKKGRKFSIISGTKFFSLQNGASQVAMSEGFVGCTFSKKKQYLGTLGKYNSTLQEHDNSVSSITVDAFVDIDPKDEAIRLTFDSLPDVYLSGTGTNKTTYKAKEIEIHWIRRNAQSSFTIQFDANGAGGMPALLAAMVAVVLRAVM